MSNASDFIIENGVLTKYVGPGGDVVIPDGVVEIGASAFSLCTKITSVTICDGMEHIGEYAFEKCRKLESICLPNTVKTIGKGAFYYCDALIALELPENVQITKVSDIVSNCFQLARLILPQSLPFEKEYETATFGLFGCNAIGLLVYPSIKLEDVSPKLQGAAVTGFTYYFERFTDPAVCESYFSQLMKKKAVFLEMILRYNDASLLQMLAERGKITKKNVDEEYLKPALQANAVQCTQFLLNWKNTHVKSEKDITASMGKQLDASPKDPYNAADMKKIWASEKAEDETLILTSYKAKEQEIETPVRIGKNKISKLGNYAFSVYMQGASQYSQKMKPSEKAAPLSKIRVIRVHEGIKEIGSHTFLGCTALEHLYLPVTVCSIGRCAFFSGYGSIYDCVNVTIHAPAGSYAETYAKDNNIPFVAE